MTARDDMDLILREWMRDEARTTAPIGLQEAIVDRARRSDQAHGWLARLRFGGRPGGMRHTTRLAYLAAVVALVASAGLVWSVLPGGITPIPSASPSPSPSLSPSPSPSASPTLPGPATTEVERADWFAVPFDYAIPAGSGIKLATGGPHQYVIAWVDGPDRPSSNGQTRYGGQGLDSGNTRGIAVALGEQAWSHGPDGRFYLRTGPAEMLADLRDKAGLELGPIVATELDGWPALMAPVNLRYANTDIHVSGPLTGFSQDFLLMTVSSQLIVGEIGDTTVFVLIWARSPEDLEAFMPTATEFVDSIHFVEQP